MKKKFSLYPSSLAEDSALCICSFAFTAAFYGDNYLSAEIMEPVRTASLVIMALCWFVLSFFNGLRLRKGFTAAAALCFALPPAGELICANTRLLKFSDPGLLAREIYRYYTALVFSGIEEAMGISPAVSSFCMLGLCLMLFGAGFIYTKKNILASE